MSTGMLWFDNSNTSLTEKIKKAKAYYQKKYNLVPSLVLVHPSMIDVTQHEGNRLEIEGMTVRLYRPVLPGHIWIGVDEPEPKN